MCLGFFSPVPDSTSSATHVSMVVFAGPWSSKKSEMNTLEIHEKLRPQRTENKHQFINNKEKLLVTQVAYFLAKGQNSYNYEECKDLLKSMLRDELQLKEEKLAEQLGQAEELRQYKVLVQSQERELSQLREKLREGRDASRALNQHLQALLTPDEPPNSQGRDLQEELVKGCRLAQHLVQKLTPENDEDNDEDVKVEEAEKVQESCAPREVRKAEEKEIPEDSVEECAVTCSNIYGPSESNQPHKNSKITFEEDQVDSTLLIDRGSSPDGWQDALNLVPVPGSTSSTTNVSMVVSAGPWPSEKSEMNTLEINEKLRPQRAENKRQFLNTKEKYLVTQVAYFLAKGQNSYNYEECKDLLKSMLWDELQLKEEKLAEQLGQAEELRQYKVLVHSQEGELSQLREKLREGRDASRALNQHLQALLTPDEPPNSPRRDLREQLTEGCRLAQHLVRKLTTENDEGEDEDVKVDDTEEVRKAEEKEVPEDSVEECAVTCSNIYGPSESNQPHKNSKITFEEDQVDSTLLIDRGSSPDGWQDALNLVPVPGSTSSTTNVSMVVSAGPWPSEKSEMNTLEINEKLRPQRAENKRQFLNTKEKYLVTQVAYFLAKGQNSYNYEECKDLLKSMLWDELQLKEEKLAEQLGQAEELRQYKVLVHSQEGELSQLREKLREGRDASRALNQHLQALLTPDEPPNSPRRDLREQLTEGCRLAQHLVRKLTTENDEGEDEDVKVDDTEEVRKAEEKEIPEDSVEECAITCSNSYGPSESNQPHKNSKVTFKEDQMDLTLLIDRESSPDVRQDALKLVAVPGSTSSTTNISMVVSAGPWPSEKSEMNTLEINEKLRPQRAENKRQFLNTKEKYLVTQVAYFLAKGQNSYNYEECKELLKSMLRDELQLKEEKLAEQLGQAEELRQYKVLVQSQERELSQLREKLREGRDASRALNQHLQALLTPDEPANSQGRDLREQLTEGCRLAQHLVRKLTPENDEDNDEDVKVEEAEKVQESCAPREVRKAEEKEVPEDSVEECAVTCSNIYGPSESNQPHKNSKITFEEDHVDSTLLIDRESSPDGWQDALNLVPVPGSTSSTTNVSMVVSAGPCPSEKSEMNTLEINEKLRPQREENKRQFINTKEKYLVTQVAYFLAKGQNSYNYEECKDLLKSMLRDELQLKEEKLAEQLGQAEELRQYKVLVQSQERELSQLREKLRKGRDASRALNQHLQALLTPDEPANSQGRDLREQLTEGCRLAQHLVRKLTPENGEDEDEDVNVEETEKVQESRAPREVQKAEEKEEPEDSLEEYSIAYSNSHGPCESHQPHSNTKITFEEDQVNSHLIDSSCHDEWEDAVSIIPENESDHEEEEEKGPVSPRNLQESEEEEALQESWDEGYSTSSIPPDMSASYQSYSSNFHSLEEQQVDLALDVGRHWCDEVKKEDQEATGPRLNRELLDEKEPEALQDSLDRFYSTPCGYLELPDLCQPYRNALYSLEEEHFGLALDMDRITKEEEEEDQGPSCPRLSRELLEVVEPEILQDSLDRYYSTPYSYLELPDSCHSQGSSFYSLEEQHVGFSLGVDEIEKYQEGEEDQNPPCPRLNGVLMEAGEPEVLQDSPNGCYWTPSSYFQLPDSFQHYTSGFYSLEEQHVSLALDMDNGFVTLTVIRFHLGFQMGVLFPH
ncbi:neuroblastoma breakpoint family member 1-like isoform X9 [Macaca thibetana thibetana]|uniref:neuroblastoma breakpoint family member 1-like isoform X9 n=1 Tax=Macaca thibetana thibetana TaxID=257877 RepID=UPI0021BC47FB|nr:neuroblastoma breakpoint family member 1-like isoform X9 [Macaca thibetana thibetana]